MNVLQQIPLGNIPKVFDRPVLFLEYTIDEFAAITGLFFDSLDEDLGPSEMAFFTINQYYYMVEYQHNSPVMGWTVTIDPRVNAVVAVELFLSYFNIAKEKIQWTAELVNPAE